MSWPALFRGKARQLGLGTLFARHLNQSWGMTVIPRSTLCSEIVVMGGSFLPERVMPHNHKSGSFPCFGGFKLYLFGSICEFPLVGETFYLHLLKHMLFIVPSWFQRASITPGPICILFANCYVPLLVFKGILSLLGISAFLFFLGAKQKNAHHGPRGRSVPPAPRSVPRGASVRQT